MLKKLAFAAVSVALAGCTMQAPAPVAAASDNSAQSEPMALERAPNIIVILTDDQGYADVGFNGSTDIPTPNIDRIANEGVRFDQGYVSFPVCGPSRAGLLTGRYQSRFGYDLNSSENPLDTKAGLPLTERTIADVLAPSGYTSAIIGKWHMGNHPQFHPLERGFDEFYGFTNGGHNYFLDRLRPIPVAEAQNGGQLYQSWLMVGREQVKTSGYLTDWLSEKAVDFVERRKDEPFFLYLAYNAPHTPMHATQEYLDRFKHIKDERRRTYAAMISAVDDGVGDVLNKLDELDLAEDTIVFFLSDNGGPLVRARNGSINLPLKGGKGDIYEGGVRVPFAMRWSGQIPAGGDYKHPVSSLDIMATAAGVNGVNAPAQNALDGVNLIPYLAGDLRNQAPKRQLFWRYPANTRDNSRIGRFGVVEGSDKLVEYQRRRMFYDLSNDKGEQTNLQTSEKARSDELQKAWERWNAQMADESAISIFNEWQGS
ncbi:sulfatase-like hydrolase/transferase [Erythrobacter sp. F6033]|uniref:sulfatase-like hydrolase/transferase n=1 Tax=Erythrobacter sp. F6033 TaxID=2926401 RepID=UPI001FF60D65|nr:sulfatase-like hydrolase/transferase [Erythrobacter sp. F6033]MCK0129290.1 sulfatase-like hydrolase/transferase [Erythrobacter sp. F6033]